MHRLGDNLLSSQDHLTQSTASKWNSSLFYEEKGTISDWKDFPSAYYSSELTPHITGQKMLESDFVLASTVYMECRAA